MGFFFEIINWWYTVIVVDYFRNKVIATFIFSMNKTRALPFVKTFNTPLYKDSSSFGKGFGKIVKFWWIGLGTIISLVRIIPSVMALIIILVLPLLPLWALLKFIFKL